MKKITPEIWMVLIVGVVAFVALTLLLTGSISNLTENLSGEAISVKTISQATISSSKCTDSDNGKDPFTKGTTKGEPLNDFKSGVKTYTDACETNAGDLKAFCTSDQCVEEYYCETNTAVLQSTQKTTGAVMPVWDSCDTTNGYKCSGGICVYDAKYRADLHISSLANIAVYKNKGTVLVPFVVENTQGISATVHSYKVTLTEVNDDGTYGSVAVYSGVDTTAIAAKGSRTISVTLSPSASWINDFEQGSDNEILKIDVSIDTSNDVAEQDETNNDYSRTMRESNYELYQGKE